MKAIVARIGGALAAGAAVAVASFAKDGNLKAAVVAGLTAAIPLAVYGTTHTVTNKEK